MLFARYRNLAPTLVGWPGEGWTVGLLPLPLDTLSQADSYAQAVQARLTGDIGRTAATLAAQCFVLHKALVTPTPPYHPLATFELLNRSLTPDQADELFERWLRVQDHNVPDVQRLERELLKAMQHDAALRGEGSIAQAEGVERLFGKPVGQLTLGQIGYFVALRSAYERGWGKVAPGATRAVSRKAMEGQP